MEPIPAPRSWPIIGNILDIDASNPVGSLTHLAEVHGPIFKVYVPKERIYAANYAVAQGLFNEQKFEKAVMGPLQEIRNLAGDGLFTAYPGEHAWEVAHRALMPAFGPLPIQAMFDEMQDIVTQMVLRWARFGPTTAIDVPDTFTRLTLDSIAICAMGDRFNSFYQEEQHPFVRAMVNTLSESFTRSRRLPFPASFYAKEDKAYQDEINTCKGVARDLLEARRAKPTNKKDLLNAMINAKDPETGEHLSDELIIRNMVTFLIAGHETTSGMLSFLCYLLLENPRTLEKAQEEVDTVIGKRAIELDDMGKLPYIEACLRETLRLYSPAPAFTLRAKGDEILAGKYLVKEGQFISVLLAKFHRDPEVYGPDAESFRPERMYKEAFRSLPPNAWKPFGNGKRACIGRSFAWQEAILAVATMLQMFHISKADQNYKLRIQTALTIKPAGFFMKAALRDPHFLDHIEVVGQAATASEDAKAPVKATAESEANLLPLNVLYGSNTGTCEALAQALASAAPEQGFKASVKCLDDGVRLISADTPVVIFTASYEGHPPDNAAHFLEWLSSASEVGKVPYAVFGVGNKEWASTYQKIPKTIDRLLAEKGAVRLVERQETDVGSEKFLDKLDKWQAAQLWPVLREKYEIKAGEGHDHVKGLSMQIDTQNRSSVLRQGTYLGEITESILLTAPGAVRKRHIGIRLPSDVTYRAGDYLAVLPTNSSDLVKRVLNRFRLPWDAVITIDPKSATVLPVGHPISAHDVLASMVELSGPASTRHAEAVAATIPDDEAAKRLKEAVAKGLRPVSLLELLEEYTSAQFSFAQFLACLSPMRIRQYSISSSPLADPSVATLTYTVIDAPNKSGSKHDYMGVCTTYLERLSIGDRIQVSLKGSRAGFHLPSNDTVPIVMACAGTGLAPFRAFIAERAIKKSNGLDVGSSLLFYGLNSPEEDDMYREEFDKWEKEGVVSVRRAYTNKPKDSFGAKFVQERIWHDRKDVVDFFRNDAQLYFCGANIVGAGVDDAMSRIRMEMTGSTEASAKEWVKQLKGDRFWSDVFS